MPHQLQTVKEREKKNFFNQFSLRFRNNFHFLDVAAVSFFFSFFFVLLDEKHRIAAEQKKKKNNRNLKRKYGRKVETVTEVKEKLEQILCF